MREYALAIIGAGLVNNLVLTLSLGLCPLVAAARWSQAVAAALGYATACLLLVAAAAAHIVDEYLLRPLDLMYLRTLAFVLIVAALAPLGGMILRKASPASHDALGRFAPLAALNSAVLGVALLNAHASRGFLESGLYALGGAAGFLLILTLFTGLRERAAAADVPAPFRGSAIHFITIGLMSLAFMGFAGLANL